MKGFFSFVLLFSLILLIIHSTSCFSNHYLFSMEKLIPIERIYQLEMNLKESVWEGAKEGSLEGISIYLLSNPEDEFNLENAKQYIKLAVHEKLSSLNSVDFEDFEFELWCGNPSKQSLNNLKKEMLLEDKLLICSNCKKLETLNCMDYLEPNFLLDISPGELPVLYSLRIGNEKGSFGISIYSKKFQISSVFLLPKEEVLLID